MTYIVRKARLKDIPQLSKLGLEIVKYHYQLDSYFKPAADALKVYEKYFKKCIYSKKSLLLVAENQGKLIGYSLAHLSSRPPVFTIQKIGIINDVYIRQEHRRHGLSKKLLQESYKWFKKNKIKHIHLVYHLNNPLAKKAWPNQGYQEFMTYTRLSL